MLKIVLLALVLGSNILYHKTVHIMFLYCYIFLIGNSGLAIVSWLWNEKSLVALNTGLAGIYLIGLINLYLG